jgi:hypothetical protein
MENTKFNYVPILKARELLGCSRSCLEKICASGKLTKYYPLGVRKPLISIAELEGLIIKGYEN